MAYTSNPVWSFAANWANGVKETLSWKTDALASETGYEQRVSRRLTPRRVFQSEFILHREKRQYAQHLIAKHGSSVWLVPIWHQVTKLQSSVVAGGDTLFIDTRWREYKVGDFVILRGDDPEVFEAVEIEQVQDDNLKLISPLELDWLKYFTYVYPSMLCTLDSVLEPVKGTDEVFLLSARFSAYQPNAYQSDWLPPLFLGYPVLTEAPDDSQDLGTSFFRMSQKLDNDINVPVRLDVVDKTLRKMSYRWGFAGREKNHKLRQFFYWLRGVSKTILLPTFMHDFTLVQTIGDGDTSITVSNCGYARLGLVNKFGFSYINISLKSGVHYQRKIMSAVEATASTETLTLDGALAGPIHLEDIQRISYLVLVRLGQDSVEIMHETDTDGLTTCYVVWDEVRDLEI